MDQTLPHLSKYYGMWICRCKDDPLSEAGYGLTKMLAYSEWAKKKYPLDVNRTRME